ncbi:MAG TPA: peptide ABC transporter substrate-binding protein [Rhizomicrobium sp.]|nr:peptide ABC transporter substrate-binding protein [Rhizomicrobium sp.]
MLRRGNSAEPTTLDPHKATTVWEDWIMGDMFVGLMHQNVNGDPIPQACETLTTSEDGLTFTIKLRDHVWSDGVPVTADDYVFSFRRIANPKTAAQYVSILYPIRNMQQAAEGKVPPADIGVRALDSRTLQIEVQYQTPYINHLLMHQTTYAVPKHVVEKHGDAWLQPENFVSNGPFLLKEWVPNDHIRVVKNPLFFGAASVMLQEVYYFPTQDASAALKRFRAGELDIANRCPVPDMVAILRKTIPKQVKINPFLSSYFIVINQKRKPFNDPRVRMALAMALDRETLVDKVIRIGQIAAYNLVPPGMPGYSYAAQMQFKKLPFEARLEKAKSLLEEAGFGPNNPLSFNFSIYNSKEWRRWAIVLQFMWRAVGVDMHILPLDSQILYDYLRKKDFDLASAGWVADYRDPKNYLFLFETSSTDLNYGSYSNANYDRLVAQSDTIRDANVRLQVMARAEQQLLDDCGVIPLMHDVTRDMVSPQVSGWVPNVANFNRSRYLSLDRSIPRS